MTIAPNVCPACRTMIKELAVLRLDASAGFLE